jgi:tetratricopeptide (TPR) repeat protein
MAVVQQTHPGMFTGLMRLPAWLPVAVLAAGAAGIGGVMVWRAHDLAVAAAVPAYTYATCVRNLDDDVAAADWRSQHDPQSWLAPAALAQCYRQRAQLTGEYVDYSRAEAALDRSFAIAPPGVGPCLARAQLSATMHRWNSIEPDLEMVEKSLPKSFERAAVTNLRAERSFQSGDYAHALDLYRQAITLDRENGVRYFGLADADNALGDRKAADDLLDHAEKLIPAHEHFTAAWLQMMRGAILMDRGEFVGAAARFAAADAAMSGWWRVQGKQADLLVLRGQDDPAVAAYTDLVRRTGNPEFMDDLARIALRRGDAAEAARWTVMARAVYAEEINDFPEAASAHALDHYLDLEHDDATTVHLAELNHSLRPGGEATAKLARAYLHAGRTAEAETLIRAVLAGPWDAPILHRVAAEIFARTGKTAEAEAERAKFPENVSAKS